VGKFDNSVHAFKRVDLHFNRLNIEVRVSRPVFMPIRRMSNMFDILSRF